MDLKDTKELQLKIKTVVYCLYNDYLIGLFLSSKQVTRNDAAYMRGYRYDAGSLH
jgi:hypothetical protein